MRYGPNHRWWVLLTVMIGNMAALMAATTINVAVPAISRQFKLGQQDAPWLATSFMGAMTVSAWCWRCAWSRAWPAGCCKPSPA